MFFTTFNQNGFDHFKILGPKQSANLTISVYFKQQLNGLRNDFCGNKHKIVTPETISRTLRRYSRGMQI